MEGVTETEEVYLLFVFIYLYFIKAPLHKLRLIVIVWP